jgi:uncharacterized protein YndB with AHSA1/START domain
MSETVTHEVEIRLRIAAPPESVYPYLIEPDRYVRWQGIKAELDPRPGGTFRVWMDDENIASGSYVELDPPRRVVITWGWEGNPELPPGSTTVEFSLTADADGTVLLLRHSGLPDAASAAMHEEGWQLFTGRLATVARGGDPGPMPAPPG